MKRLGVFLLPPALDGMLVHYRVTTSIKFAGTNLYTWVERGSVRVKTLAQVHNMLSPARARTQTAQCGDKHTNHEATKLLLLPDKWTKNHDICILFFHIYISSGLYKVIKCPLSGTNRTKLWAVRNRHHCFLAFTRRVDCHMSSVIFFWLNTLKGYAKAPTMDLLRLSTSRGTKNHFF